MTCKTCLNALRAKKLWRATRALLYTHKKADGPSVSKKIDGSYVTYLPYAAKKDVPFAPYMLKDMACHAS